MILTRRRRLAVVERFEAFVASHHPRPPLLAEICATIGVSERTLRTCCQEYLGVSPTRYMRLRRMRLARRALLDAIPESTTVAAIAIDNGFF
jgi:AraC-like DNA-binding protein